MQMLPAVAGVLLVILAAGCGTDATSKPAGPRVESADDGARRSSPVMLIESPHLGRGSL